MNTINMNDDRIIELSWNLDEHEMNKIIDHLKICDPLTYDKYLTDKCNELVDSF